MPDPDAGGREGVFVTDLVCPYPFTPLVRDPDGGGLTGHAALGIGQPSGASLTGQRPPLAALLEHDAADPCVPGLAAAAPSELPAPALTDVAGRPGKACVWWRRDGR